MRFIKSEEIRQWTYCPNIIFFRVFGKKYKGQTMKMKLGSLIHDKNAIHYLWEEIGFKGKIKTNQKVVDQHNKMIAQIDIIYHYPEDNDQVMILEIKTGKKFTSIQDHHLQQLAFQAYVVENVLCYRVREIGVYYLKAKQVIKVSYTDKIKRNIKNTIDSLREMFMYQIKPYVAYTSKCTVCEYQNQCWG